MNIDEMNWLHPLLGWQREASDPSDPTEFLDALRFELSSQEVYVLTPKGDVIPLPDGATPVDFAYAVHTEVGHKCIGARVNGKLVPLGSTLSNGDVIEIFTSKSDTAGPSQDWLGFVKSRRARTKIRQYFNKERCEEAIETGKDAIVKARRERHRRGRIDGAGVVVRGVDDRSVGLARCCTPIPGDAVFGFVARSGEVWVHREDCAKADDLRAQPERMREVTWKPTSASTFLVAIQVEALDRHKLLADITKVLFDERVEVLSATVSTTRDQVAIGRLSFVMADPQHLGHLFAAVRQVDGVYDAYRITSGA